MTSALAATGARIPWFLIAIGLFLAFDAGAWVHFDYPSPKILLNWRPAGPQCVQYVKSHMYELFPYSQGEVRKVGEWVKNGKIVVRLGMFGANRGEYSERICVVEADGTQARIVPPAAGKIWN